ncbi:MAG: hypothetical protein IT559_05535 [Alphaproteobacteria bacterium]|nr:hypothetical protein [Alphaproteobacteria bacterium]
MKEQGIFGYIRTHLFGCFELALFMKSGISYFKDDARALKISFIVVLFSMMTAIPIVIDTPALVNESSSETTSAAIYVFRYLTSLALFLGSMHWITQRLKCHERYRHFIIVSNWFSLPLSLLALSGYFLISPNHSDTEYLEGFFLIILLYGVSVGAHMTTHVLRTRPELAVLITMWGLVIDVVVHIASGGY